MKYWNKQKAAREHWTKVILHNNIHSWHEKKLWCQLQESKGRFYSGPYTRTWYFQYPEDAVVFKIQWI